MFSGGGRGEGVGWSKGNIGKERFIVHLIKKLAFNFVEQILQHEEILDFARIKFRDLDPNLRSCGYEILRGEK